MSSLRTLGHRLCRAPAVMLTALLPVSACASTAVSPSPDSDSAQIVMVKPANRLTAPALSGKTIMGGSASLAQYKGKVVVINFWGSWCAPCRAEAPNLARAAKEDAHLGVQFLGINTRDLGIANAARFDKTFGITYPSIFDPDGKLLLRFPKGTVNPQSLPATVVVDRHGRLAARVLAALSEEQLHKLIDPIAAEK